MIYPTISVIVPCYNQAQFLDECLQSVLDQTCQNWECIIVNDGSPDNTEEIALKWMEQDSRFKYLKKENGGLSSARNAGIDMAQGEWILPLDSDDRIHPEYLLLASAHFEEDVRVITANGRFFGSFEAEWRFPPYEFKNLLCRNTLFCTSFFRKADWQEAGGYDEAMRKGFEDWEFWIRLLQQAPEKFLRIGRELFYYRKKDTSMLMDLNENISGVQDYIYQKHRLLYTAVFGSYMDILQENFYLRQGTAVFKRNLESRRYRLAGKFFGLYDRLVTKKNSL